MRLNFHHNGQAKRTSLRELKTSLPKCLKAPGQYIVAEPSPRADEARHNICFPVGILIGVMKTPVDTSGTIPSARHGRRMWYALGAAAAIIVLSGVLIGLKHWRDQLLFMDTIQQRGGYVSFEPIGPAWLQQHTTKQQQAAYAVLNVVSLDKGRFTDSDMTLLNGRTNLVILALGKTQVTDAGLLHLRNHSDLERLSLWETDVTDTGLAHLSGLRNLRVLYLNGTKVTDAGIAHLTSLTNLKFLYVANTQVTDNGLRQFKGLTNLESVSLNGTKVTDAGLRHLTGLKNLTGLFLKDTAVTDAGLVHLKTLPNLECVDLTGTSVTEPGIENLQKSLPPGCEIRR
jgi:hypothetical protein